MVASVASVSSASQATSYYEVDNYYTKEESINTSNWHGQLAEHYGLEGRISPEMFEQVLSGKTPDGATELGRGRNGKWEHKPGTDLTFSAPKSVSILAEEGGDLRLHAAMEEAVKVALDYVEKHVAMTRKNGVLENADKLLISMFRHDTSRNLDPQTHIHAVIANMAMRQDGEIRSLNEHSLYVNQKLIGAIFHNELAVRVQELGYEIYRPETAGNGEFEVGGISREVIEAKSTRRAELLNALKERGLATDDAKLAEISALMTRQRKTVAEKEVCQEIWREQSKDLGFDASKLVDEAIQKSRDNPLSLSMRSGPSGAAMTSLKWAIDHLSEREAVFTMDAAVATSLAHSVGKFTTEELYRAKDSLLASGDLIRAEITGPRTEGKEGLTTARAMRLEAEVLDLMVKGQGKHERIVPLNKIEKAAEQWNLNREQTDAVKMVMSSKDASIGVVGMAGVGKTTMFQALKSVLSVKNKKVELVGVAPSGSAAQNLQKETGIPSDTLAMHLINVGKDARTAMKGGREAGKLKAKYSNQVWLVDEAGMGSTAQVRDLEIARHVLGARIVYAGDQRQLAAIEAGRPFDLLQKAGMQISTLTQIYRQKNPRLLGAVYDLAKGESNLAFEKLLDDVTELPANELVQAVAEKWLNSKERDQTLVLTAANKDREEISNIIRERLYSEGILKGDRLNTTILSPMNLTKPQMKRSIFFKPGDRVRFGRSYKNRGVEKDKYYTVHGIDNDRNKLVLTDEKGKQVEITPSRHASRMEVYREMEREIAAGDTLKWTRNNRKDGMLNSQRVRVESVDVQRNSAVIMDSAGKNRTISLDDPQYRHFDHAYALTIHDAQGLGSKNVISLFKTGYEHLNTIKQAYVAVSRAKENIYIHTDSHEKYLSQISNNPGDKSSAIEGAASLIEKETGKSPDIGELLTTHSEAAEKDAGTVDLNTGRGKSPEKEPGINDGAAENKPVPPSRDRDIDLQI
jgi:conjugative relaxase-like TrwC/TraI family protein